MRCMIERGLCLSSVLKPFCCFSVMPFNHICIKSNSSAWLPFPLIMYLTSAEKGKTRAAAAPGWGLAAAAKAQNKHHQVTYTNTQLTWANDDVVRPVSPVATFAKWHLWEINFLWDTLYFSKVIGLQLAFFLEFFKYEIRPLKCLKITKSLIEHCERSELRLHF